MMDLEFSNKKIKLSDWNSEKFDSIDRVAEIEKHPLMIADQDIPVKFLVTYSALDRVIDAFGLDIKEFTVTGETKVEFIVRTSAEEAFRWALANADVEELVSPQDIRDRLGRIANPMYERYTYTLDDKTRENIDKTLADGIFRISRSVDENLALQTFRELKKRGKTGEIKKIAITSITKEPEDYLGDFTNTYYLMVSYSPECKYLSWAHRLKNIQYLEVFQTQIEDISWIKEMKDLISVDIEKSPIDNLSMLNEHKNIRTLRLKDLNIEDISFIESYPNLFSLKLVGCPIQDYSPLFRLKSYLKCLEIDKKAADQIDLKKLKEKHIGIVIKFEDDFDDLDFLY
jgi:hypothetical protein